MVNFEFKGVYTFYLLTVAYLGEGKGGHMPRAPL